MFSLSAMDKEGRDAVYLFRESAAPDFVVEKAKNMVVVLPVYTAEDIVLSTIHLYPKNEKVRPRRTPFEKIVPDQSGKLSIWGYRDLRNRLRCSIGYLKVRGLKWSDVADLGLVYQAASLKVLIGRRSHQPLVSAGRNRFRIYG